MIPPDAQRAMAKRAGATVVETKGSHAVYVSQAQAVTSLIEQAVTASIAAV
jgi:predicted RNA binding protein YcfA (HicA-like mRNA interferase family)